MSHQRSHQEAHLFSQTCYVFLLSLSQAIAPKLGISLILKILKIRFIYGISIKVTQVLSEGGKNSHNPVFERSFQMHSTCFPNKRTSKAYTLQRDEQYQQTPPTPPQHHHECNKRAKRQMKTASSA